MESLILYSPLASWRRKPWVSITIAVDGGKKKKKSMTPIPKRTSCYSSPFCWTNKTWSPSVCCPLLCLFHETSSLTELLAIWLINLPFSWDLVSKTWRPGLSELTKLQWWTPWMFLEGYHDRLQLDFAIIKLVVNITGMHGKSAHRLSVGHMNPQVALERVGCWMGTTICASR